MTTNTTEKLTPVTFAPQTTFAAGTYPTSVSVTDVNDDGNADIVTANKDSDNVSVLLGDGKGNFAPPTTFAVGTNPSSASVTKVNVMDVNGDGKPDLVTASTDRFSIPVVVANDGNTNVSVLLGDDKGNFAPPTTFAAGTNPSSVSVTDVNSDGNADIVTANFSSDNVSVLLGDGKGSFAPPTTFAVGTYPNSASVTDVNGDGKLDVVTANSGSNNVSLLLGDGKGSFAPPTTFAVGTYLISMSVTDVNGDGKLDVVTANSGSNNVSVLLNTTGNVPTNQAPIGNVTITGNTEQNETLTASNTLADADGLGKITYQWLSDDVAIKDANETTYALTQTDVGKKISVTASYVDSLGNEESVTDGLGIVNVNDLPTGSVVISGDAQQGKTLTVSNTLADLDGLGTISYQWLSGDVIISGANQTSYTLTAADVNKAISVKASYTDLQNTAESMTSTKTPLVTSNASSKPTNGDDKLIGTAKGDMLNGGFGFDELTGGKGADKFVYKSIKDAPVSHSKIEVITDFSSSEKDKIDLSGIDADTSKVKDQAFSKPDMGAEFSGIFTKAGQLFFDTTSHILYGNVNADETADFVIQLSGVTSLVAGDFIL